MPRVVHLLPYDGIGGAESAAKSIFDGPTGAIAFEIRYVFPDVHSAAERRRTNNPLTLIVSIRALARLPPDILIVSLWRAAMVGVVVRLLCPRVKLVTLIHNSVDAHILDYVVTRLAMRLSSAVWVDSHESAALRFGRCVGQPFTVIPFLTRSIPALPEPRRASPYFAFWGRLAPQKNLPRAIALFRRVWREFPEARFLVIGPDNGELGKLRVLSAQLGLSNAIEFTGALTFERIRDRVADCTFYLQTSDYEGMAISVIEAMQLGLIPVVTAVGEIRRYGRRGVNAIIVGSTDESLTQIRGVLHDAAAFTRMRSSAVATWADAPLYRDAVLAECARLALAC